MLFIHGGVQILSRDPWDPGESGEAVRWPL